MNREQFVRELMEAGDAVINYINSKGKEKYVVATLDLSTPYIALKGKCRRSSPEEEDRVIIFSWDEDKFKFMDYKTVTSIVPLASILQNESEGSDGTT